MTDEEVIQIKVDLNANMLITCEVIVDYRSIKSAIIITRTTAFPINQHLAGQKLPTGFGI